MPSASFSLMRGIWSLWLSLWDSGCLGALASRVSVLPLGSQDCSLSLVLYFLPFHGQSPLLTYSSAPGILSYFSLISWPTVPFLPLCLSRVEYTFSARVAMFFSLLTSSSDSYCCWRPQLILLSIVLIPQTWLVCPTSLFPLLLPHR